MVPPRQIHRFRPTSIRGANKRPDKSLTRRLASTIDKSSFRWIKLESNYYLVQVEPCSRPLPSNKLNRSAILHEPFYYYIPAYGSHEKEGGGQKGEKITAEFFFSNFSSLLSSFSREIQVTSSVETSPFLEENFTFISLRRIQGGIYF